MLIDRQPLTHDCVPVGSFTPGLNVFGQTEETPRGNPRESMMETQCPQRKGHSGETTRAVMGDGHNWNRNE